MITTELKQFNNDVFQTYKPQYPLLQLGFFNDNLILFVGQNPGTPFDTESTYIEKAIIQEQTFDEYARTYEKMIKQCKIGYVISKIIKDKWHKISFTNIVKIPTTNNEKPSDDMIQTFMPILDEQINLLQPKLVVLLGKFAGNCFDLYTFYSYSIIHNICFTMVPHPSYLLRSGTVTHETEEINKFINNMLIR